MAKLEIFIGYLGLIPQYHTLNIPYKEEVITTMDTSVSQVIQDHISMRKYLIKTLKKSVTIPQKRFTQKIHKSERK